MKTLYSLLLSAILIFCHTHSQGQAFGSNNATWTFSITNWAPPYVDAPVTLTASPTYLIGNDSCRNINIVNSNGCAAGGSSFIITQRNDSVLYFFPPLGDFTMLYNYNAAVGDTQTIHALSSNGLDTSVQLVVTATGTMNINGSLKRTYTTQQLDYYFYFGGMVIEDIGNTGFLFPQYGFCDPIYGGIRCYEDSIIGLYNFNPAISCDSIIYLDINDPIHENEVTLGPNPFESEITIDFHQAGNTAPQIEITNMLGEQIHFTSSPFSISSLAVTLYLDPLPSGLYFLQLTYNNRLFTRKIIKV